MAGGGGECGPEMEPGGQEDSLPSISPGSVSEDSMHCRLRTVREKTFQKVPKSKTRICHTGNYLNSI